MNITHLFYHQETVEEACARNSWLSIRDWFGPEDEVIVLDLGVSLSGLLPISVRPKFLRFEQIRTDNEQERSYTYGLNTMIPLARGEWVVLWRSDYVYCEKYYAAVLAGMQMANVVLPYEAYIGASYCDGKWTARRLARVRAADESFVLKHACVCPVYEYKDFAHFAMRKEVWIRNHGMATALWGYGYKYPEFFHRIKTTDPEYRESIQRDMLAFHQYHTGSQSGGARDGRKARELQEAKTREIAYFGSAEAREKFIASTRQPPLFPRRPDWHYARRRPRFDLRLAIAWRLSALRDRLRQWRRG